MRSVLLFGLFFLALTVNHSAEGAPGGADRLWRLDVSFDIPRAVVRGVLTIPVGAGENIDLRTGPLQIERVSLNGTALEAPVRDGLLHLTAVNAGTLEVRYEGTFRGGEAVGDRNFGVVSSSIDARGISLTGPWHPQPEGAVTWLLTATLPAGYEAVSEAEQITRTPAADGVRFSFDFPHPVDALSFVASERFEVTRERQGNVELEAFFFREDRELAKTYLQAAKRYVELYEKMLTPFPFRRFAVVENFLPTGYSMPTFTLLGQDVVRLPFITETSLGHEILHQWFGNSVYVAYDRGNWVEGLTTYLADHWYEEQKGKGWEYRKQLLVNYAAYVGEKNELSLREFTTRMDLASRAIGYGKAAMVFHMLRLRMGDDAFFDALRDLVRTHSFKAVSWDDLADAFTKRSGGELAAFLRSWVDGKGLPELGVESASVRRKGSRFEITLELTRKNGSQSLEVPVVISFLNGGTRNESVTVAADSTTASLLVDDEPSLVVLDPDYDLARRPVDDELPAVIARLIGEDRPLVVPASDGDSYDAVIAEFTRDGTREDRVRPAIKDSEIRTSSLIVLGADNPVIGRLFGSMEIPAGGFSITVRKNPWNAARIVAIVHSRSAEETARALPKISHYGKYSFLSFDKGKNREKRIDPGERGIIILFRTEPVAVDLSLLRTFGAVLDGVGGKRIVYVGEYHDRFSHHNIQLQVIRSLHRTAPPVAVGMEMFQRPFQKVLDEYIAGAINEAEFLKRAEYFKRWSFDYNLYKPILDFCRAEKIPVVALNIRREITEKVSKSGLDSLDDDERQELPREMDLSDGEYRARLREVFGQHQGNSERDFDLFFQAQVLWDETMAESIADYLARHADHRMIVIAGGGHIAYGSGIPRRAFRRNGLPYAIILNDGEIVPDIADYIVLPEPLDGLTAPKLMATFTDAEDRLVFRDFVKESPAKQAGIRAGDALLALDGVPVGKVEDVKRALHYKSKGDSILVTVARKRFLLGEKVLTVEVKL